MSAGGKLHNISLSIINRCDHWDIEVFNNIFITVVLPFTIYVQLLCIMYNANQRMMTRKGTVPGANHVATWFSHMLPRKVLCSHREWLGTRAARIFVPQSETGKKKKKDTYQPLRDVQEQQKTSRATVTSCIVYKFRTQTWPQTVAAWAKGIKHMGFWITSPQGLWLFRLFGDPFSWAKSRHKTGSHLLAMATSTRWVSV